MWEGEIYSLVFCWWFDDFLSGWSRCDFLNQEVHWPIRLLSGLSPNHDKSSMFLCGVEHISNTRLLEVLGYKEGNLPIKYLGVLLSLKNSHLLITWSLWTVLWLRPGLGWIAPSHMKVDFNLLSSSSFLFRCNGLLFSFFRRLLQWRSQPCYVDFWSLIA
jgi:hypothetical protein